MKKKENMKRRNMKRTQEDENVNGASSKRKRKTEETWECGEKKRERESVAEGAVPVSICARTSGAKGQGNHTSNHSKYGKAVQK